MDSSFPTPPSRFSLPEVSLIVPARNEESSLGACLESLTAQSGVAFEIIVVDDASSDRTREIAQSFPGVRVISADSPPPDRPAKTWTGKNNALVAGTREARAPWLLFTDADTIHQTGSLARALDEAKREQADLLSYSPDQVAVTFAERAVMPVVFAELAARYPLNPVRDRSCESAAANGQYILVRRTAYDAAGGHAAVGAEILEDVALARRFCQAARRVRFRYGGDAVRTRMYRNWAELREGWTKNLALLFPRSGILAIQSFALWLAVWSSLAIALAGALTQHVLWILSAALSLLAYRRIRAAHFRASDNWMALGFGLPLFAYLLLRSKQAHRNGRVLWKGRAYHVGVESDGAQPEKKAA
ncbi:MAG: glycosyltransferase family 2 protein [Terriglobales bacterium]